MCHLIKVRSGRGGGGFLGTLILVDLVDFQKNWYGVEGDDAPGSHIANFQDICVHKTDGVAELHGRGT